MRCPHCHTRPSSVLRTTRPLNEGLEEGLVKERLRKCRNCGKNFSTFEIHESLFRTITERNKTLSRTPLSRRKKSVDPPPLTS